MSPHALIGQMSVGQVSVDQMSVGQVSVGQMGVAQVSRIPFVHKKEQILQGPKSVLLRFTVVGQYYNLANEPCSHYVNYVTTAIVGAW